MREPMEKILSNAKKFKLEAKVVNDTTLSIYSRKYIFDSWLIRQEGENLVLLHLTKSLRCNRSFKCTYHFQKRVHEKNWVWLMQYINKHNKYVINKKKNIKGNLVDDVLKKYREEREKNGK